MTATTQEGYCHISEQLLWIGPIKHRYPQTVRMMVRKKNLKDRSCRTARFLARTNPIVRTSNKITYLNIPNINYS